MRIKAILRVFGAVTALSSLIILPSLLLAALWHEKTVLPFLIQRMRDTGIYCAVEFVSSVGNKEAKARSFQGMQQIGQVYWPNTEWAERCIDQMLRFPAGKNDDVVDACSVLGRFLAQVWQASPRPPKPKTIAEVWNQPLTMGDILR
jgi:hypothetical protein